MALLLTALVLFYQAAQLSHLISLTFQQLCEMVTLLRVILHGFLDAFFEIHELVLEPLVGDPDHIKFTLLDLRLLGEVIGGQPSKSFATLI